MHKMYPPDGFKGERYSDKDGDFVRTKSGSYAIENSSENMGFDKEIERIELSGKSKMTKIINKVENSATSIGIVSDFNERLVSGVKNAGGYAKVLGKIGRVTGIGGLAISGYNVYRNPTAGNYIKLGINIGMVAIKVNPALGVILGISDITRFTDKVINNAIK